MDKVRCLSKVEEHERKLGMKRSMFKVVNDLLVNVMDSIILPSEPKKKKRKLNIMKKIQALVDTVVIRMLN